MHRCTPEQPYWLMPLAANNKRRHKNTGNVNIDAISYQSVLIHCSNNSRPFCSRRTTSGGVSARQARLTTRRKRTASRRTTHTSTAHSRQPASINSWNRYLNIQHTAHQPNCHQKARHHSEMFQFLAWLQVVLHISSTTLLPTHCC